MSTLLGIASAINTSDKKGYRLTYSAEGDTTGIVMLTGAEAALVAEVINTDNWLAVEQKGYSGCLKIDLDNPMTDSEVKEYVESLEKRRPRIPEKVNTKPTKVDEAWLVLRNHVLPELEKHVRTELGMMPEESLDKIISGGMHMPKDMDFYELRDLLNQNGLYPNEVMVFPNCLRIGAYKFITTINNGTGFIWDTDWDFLKYDHEDSDTDTYMAVDVAITEFEYKLVTEVKGKRRIDPYGLYLSWLLFLKSCYMHEVVKSYYKFNKNFLRVAWWQLIRETEAYKELSSIYVDSYVYERLDAAEKELSNLYILSDIYNPKFGDYLDAAIKWLSNLLIKKIPA